MATTARISGPGAGEARARGEREPRLRLEFADLLGGSRAKEVAGSRKED